MIKIIAPLVFITLFISCNDSPNLDKEKLSDPLVLKDGLLYVDSLSTTPFTGRHKSRMRDMKIEYEVINGLREGAFIVFFPNDSIQMKGKMKNNKNSGEWIYYYPNGALETTGFFEDDVPSGKWIWYNENGIVLEEGNFINGDREGEWNSYDSTGRLVIVRIYKDNDIIDSTKVN